MIAPPAAAAIPWVHIAENGMVWRDLIHVRFNIMNTVTGTPIKPARVTNDRAGHRSAYSAAKNVRQNRAPRMSP